MLIDLVMLEMDGCVLADRFRQSPAFAHAKIVAITGHVDPENNPVCQSAKPDELGMSVRRKP